MCCITRCQILQCRNYDHIVNTSASSCDGGPYLAPIPVHGRQLVCIKESRRVEECIRTSWLSGPVAVLVHPVAMFAAYVSIHLGTGYLDYSKGIGHQKKAWCM